MNTFSLDYDYESFNVDASAALQRFESDVKLMCAGSTRGAAASTAALQAFATRAYRTALFKAAGRPYDRSWVVFASAIEALVAAAAPDTSYPGVAAAVSRLQAILDENPDLLV
jgi:hypothetical protein